MFRKKSPAKHRARQSRIVRDLERTVRRERVAWFMAGKQYPSAPGKHAAGVA